jgi:CHAT domain-containing protein
LVYATIGQPPKALEFYQQALPLLREVGDKRGEATTLGNIAAVEESQGRLTDASRHLHNALMIFEEMRESLSGLSEAKVSFLESHLASYHSYINLLLKQKSPTAAFAWAQKTKARALLDLMFDGKVDVSQAMTEDERKRERELKWQAGQLNKQLVAEAVKKEPDQAQLAQLKQGLAQAESELQTFTDALYARHPRLADKRAARTVTLGEVAQFLPPDTALLDYVVLKARNLDKVVLFCVTVEASRQVRTPGKAVMQVYPIEKNFEELTDMADKFRWSCAVRDAQYRRHGRQLYNLLIAPAAKQLAGKTRLIVCPDGPLWGLPFQALRVTSDEWRVTRNGKKTPVTRHPSPVTEPFLIEQYEITYAYSATGVEAALRAKSDPKRGKAAGTLLAMANPDFGGEAARVNPSRDGHGAVVREVFLRGESGLSPLKGTQVEANALKANFPNAAIYTGAQAQEATAKQDGGKFRYLHFATHGLLNDAAPLMSSIALAQPPNDSDEDGFLTAREVFDLNLSADMVVLSACNTARGDKRRGEGVVGLTWALFVAGAPTQVLSQWAVLDESTAELMKRFYAQLRQGKPKGAALRAATLTMMKDGRHEHPFYWAPFVLVGDWR